MSEPMPKEETKSERAVERTVDFDVPVERSGRRSPLPPNCRSGSAIEPSSS